MRALSLALVLAASGAAAAESVPSVRPLALPRIASGGVKVDGDLSEEAWRQAARIETFYETAFGDNRAPTVKTVALVAYDERFFYVGLLCDDPDPSKIRAPYVDRDGVLGNQDNVAIFLDTRNDRRSALEFRVNPRGIQADGIFNDANFDEDFSPDFYYETAARITERGWQAEVRIPLSSLRYPGTDPQTWGLMVWRNYPREFRYAIYSSPIPRGSNCYICHLHDVTGITGLPSTSHYVLAPYVSGQDVARAPEVGAPIGDGEGQTDVGLDLKWTPSADTALDAAIHPDFSQVEADVAQIAVNNRFALFYPEKRPFFLEGVDLFGTPFQAVYTRTITSPDWGARVTGKLGSSSYTFLVAKDAGGGSVILPGPQGSDFAPQDYRSIVGIGRVRRDFGPSFVGVIFTGREIEGEAAYNTVFGPDFQWRPSERDSLTGQLLRSETLTPERPDLAAEWDGRKLGDHALSVDWGHRTRTFDAFSRYRDVGAGFRADEGFVAQVGYREGYEELGYSFFPEKGLFNQLRPYASMDYTVDRDGGLLNRRVQPGLNFQGRHNLVGFVGVNLDRVLTGDVLLSRTQVPFSLQIDPSRRVPRIGIQGFVGQEIDLAGVRVGDGADLALSATLRPTDHLSLDVNSALSWLDVDDTTGRRGRLFTAQVQRLKVTYNASARLFLRLIGQYVFTQRDVSLYPYPVPREDGFFSGSALFSYRINWQTALFLGYGDDRALDPRGELVKTGRQLFFKVSYAFQR